MNNLKYDELYKKYLTLLEKNSYLKEKIKELEAEPIAFEAHPKTFQTQESLFQKTWKTGSDKQLKEEIIEADSFSDKSVNHYSVKDDKINLFMSLFKGRCDVFAKRCQNKKGQSGYSPFCLNEWVPGACNKHRIKCSKCDKK